MPEISENCQNNNIFSGDSKNLIKIIKKGKTTHVKRHSVTQGQATHRVESLHGFSILDLLLLRQPRVGTLVLHCHLPPLLSRWRGVCEGTYLSTPCTLCYEYKTPLGSILFQEC